MLLGNEVASIIAGSESEVRLGKGHLAWPITRTIGVNKHLRMGEGGRVKVEFKTNPRGF